MSLSLTPARIDGVNVGRGGMWQLFTATLAPPKGFSFKRYPLFGTRPIPHHGSRLMPKLLHCNDLTPKEGITAVEELYIEGLTALAILVVPCFPLPMLEFTASLPRRRSHFRKCKAEKVIRSDTACCTETELFVPWVPS